jgi:hypothetical protein
MGLGTWFRSLFGATQEAKAGSPASVGRWCLVGNIVHERPCGEGGREIQQGTKHFSPGTEVYCLPTQWGDGYQRIIVIGRHRGSKRFVWSSCYSPLGWRQRSLAGTAARQVFVFA